MPSAPRLSGRTLRTLATLTRTGAGAGLVYRALRADLRIGRLAMVPKALHGPFPVDNHPLAGRPPRAAEDAGHPRPEAPWSAHSDAFVSAYRAGTRSPRDVVVAAFAAARALAAQVPSVGPLLDLREAAALAEADASTERWRRGDPLGPFDGVPIAVKEQVAVAGMPSRGGSDLTDPTPAAEDSTCVARLRAAGAIVIGTTPMTELGMSPVGYNPKRVMPRNPHAADRVAGGSSTGSGVAVATGLVPLAVGVDGGGSIRIPAGLCGVFGIKPTWGRVSRHAAMADGTVSHVGPLASSTVDLASFLDVVAGADGRDVQAARAPAPRSREWTAALSRGVRGLRIGVDALEWADASPSVAKAGQEALRALEKDGAVLVDVRLELAPFAAAIGYLAIGMESLGTLDDVTTGGPGAAFNPDLAIVYAALGQASVEEYLLALRLRSGLRVEAARLFGTIDLLALPTTAATAARATDAQMASGFLDAAVLDGLCRYSFLANLTGLPASSAPVGLDEDRLPIGLQLVGDAWDEATALAACAHLERTGVARVEKPAHSVRVL